MTGSPSLHFFYPQNDNALGRNVLNYTATPAAVALQRAGEALPMWYGRAGDRFVTQGVPDEWFTAVSRNFNLHVEPLQGDTDGLAPAPWGWSRASRQELQRLGVTSEALPTDARLEALRQLSHRRTAMLLGRKTGIYDGVEAFTPPEALQAVNAFGGHAVVKLPWSGSGRGVFDTVGLTSDEILRQCDGKIRRQCSVFIEPFYKRACDLALLYDGSQFVGYSLFEVDEHYAWTSNIVASDASLLKMLQARGVKVAELQQLKEKISDALSCILGDYHGPLSVDMMLTSDGRLMLSEVNLRMTMGRVAHEFAARHLAEGLTARLALRRSGECRYSAAQGRLTAGTVPLTPPDRPWQFTVSTI